MFFLDYLTFALALIFFKPVSRAILGYPLKFLKLWRDSLIYQPVLQLEFKGNCSNLKRWLVPFGIVLFSLFCWPFLNWSAIDSSGYLRAFFLVAGFVITWKAATIDVDLSTNKSLIAERIVLVLAWGGMCFYPTFAILVLFITINSFRAWTHHQHLPIRLLLLFCSYLASVLLIDLVFLLFSLNSPNITNAGLIVLSMFLIASHYFVAGVAKAKLGPHWYSWVKDNKIHYLMSSAYLWGWLRFLPEKSVTAFLAILKRFDVPIQAWIFLVECGSILALFHVKLGLFLLAGFILSHGFIFLLTGICFWESIAIESLFFMVLYTLPEQEVDAIFNLVNGIGFALAQIILIKTGLLWRPTRLAWWDSPFVCRIHWNVVGISGKVYGLYNNFMSPQERLFGKVYSFSLMKEKMITDHLGEVVDLRLRDAIEASKGNPAILHELTHLHGHFVHNQKLEDYHDRYLMNFFLNFNAKKRKRVCPVWMKAPGELFFYWGNLEPFQGQEPVVEVDILYREEFYDGTRFRMIKDKFLRRLVLSTIL